jgi:hypothetical protein
LLYKQLTKELHQTEYSGAVVVSFLAFGMSWVRNSVQKETVLIKPIHVQAEVIKIVVVKNTIF